MFVLNKEIKNQSPTRTVNNYTLSNEKKNESTVRESFSCKKSSILFLVGGDVDMCAHAVRA